MVGEMETAGAVRIGAFGRIGGEDASEAVDIAAPKGNGAYLGG